MKPFSRGLFLLFAILSLMLFTTGCEQLLTEIPFLGNIQPSNQQTVTETPSPTPIPQTTSTVVTPEVDPNQIILWLPPEFDPENGTEAGTLLKEQLESFATDQPDLNIEIRIKAPTGAGGMLDTLSSASLAAPGVVPGILIMTRTEFEKAARAGLLMPLDTEVNLGAQTQYLPFAHEMTFVKGTQYGLPFAGDALCMAYKPLEVAYPHTRWQELVKVNIKVFAFPASDSRGLLQTLLYTSLGGVFGGDETKITLNEPALQESLLLLSEGANANTFPTWLTDYSTFDQSWEALLNSNASYALVWVSQFLADMPDNVTIGTLPAWEDKNYTLADGWVLAFPQTSAEQLLHYQLLADYLLESKFQGKWTEAIGLLPATEEALNRWNNEEVSGILLEVGRSAHPLPGNLVMSEIGPLFQQATIEMIRKQTTYIESSNKVLKALSE